MKAHSRRGRGQSAGYKGALVSFEDARMKMLPLPNVVCCAVMFWIGATLTGCTQPRSVVWSPDSASIIFPTDVGGFAAVDLGTKQKRIIPTIERNWTQLPGIGPGGDQLAIVMVQSSQEADHLQVLTQNMAGQRLQESRVFEWPQDNGPQSRRVPRATSVYWAQNGRWLLFWFVSGLKDQLRFGKYDFQTGNLTKLEDTLPLVDLFQVGMTPVREDDGGYLATRKNASDQPDLYFVTWEGWEQPLIGRREQRLFERPTYSEVNQNPAQVSRGPQLAPLKEDPRALSQRLPLTASRWRLGQLRFGLGRGESEINTLNLLTNYRLNETLVRSREPLSDQRVFLRVPIGTGKFVAQVRASTYEQPLKFFVEISNTEEKSTLLIGRAVLENEGFCPIVSAPNGKAVALTHSDDAGRIFTTVIDDQGQARLRFQISGPGWKDDITTDRPANVALRDKRSTSERSLTF
jgi:hypothetical protein